MKNLELFQLLRDPFKETYTDISYIAFQDEYTFFLKNAQLHVLEGDDMKVFKNTFNCITQFEVLKIEKILWFGTGKEFVWVDLKKELHIIPFNIEFTAAAWNPSQDVIAVVQPDGEVGVFVVNFADEITTPIETSHLFNETPNTVINVGWGSEKTQFRGTSGKLVKIVKTEIAINHNDDMQPKISWRGNGDMFAVNYSDNGQRKFKVFKFPCELIYVSSDIIGLQPIIAWKPEGNLITSVTHTNEKCEITFFEKNGLIKNALQLDQKVHVLNVKWSPCGQVFAIHCTFDDNVFVDLYTTKNYVWYLKQRLSFATSNPLIQFEFHETVSTIIAMKVITAQETLRYFFKFVVHVSPMYENKTSVTCAVINGNNIWLSNCESGLTPPPSFDCKIIMKEPVNFIVFHPAQPLLGVVDCHNDVYVYGLDTKLVGTFTEVNHTLDVPLSSHHFVLYSNILLMFLKETLDGAYKMIVNMNNKTESFWKNDKEAALTSGLTSLSTLDGKTTHIEQVETELILIDDVNESTVLYSLPSISLRNLNCKINNTLFTFTLIANQDFYVNESKIFSGVLSFIIHEKYLLLTTNENNLLCLRLNGLIKENILSNAYSHATEQGSYLLFGIPHSSSVVLQMPRGNIEICTVRMMTIDRVENLIEQQQWKDAVHLARLERLNMTILVDLNFDRFINNVDKFIKSVETPSVINDFLLALQKENVLGALYKDCLFNTCNEVIKGKVERVCNCMIEYMEKINYTYYLNCIIIACFVKNSKTSNYEALGHIQNLLHAMKEDRSVIKIAESAFNGINTLKPNSDMYDNALLMYDLDLALFVARNLQMDPKEYEPFISDLKKQDEIARRFIINDYLKKHNAAVKYLMRYRENEEIINYVKRHEVYHTAFNYSKRGSEVHKQIAVMYSEHLRKQKFYEEAAAVLSSVELFSDAYSDFKNSLMATNAVLALNQMKLYPNERNQKLKELAQACALGGKILDASKIYENYLSDYHTAMDLYIKNHYFSEALMCAAKFNCYDEYKTHMLEHILEYCEELLTKLKVSQESFNKYKIRLATVKTGKIKKITMVRDNMQHPGFIDDVMSIADTASTVATTRQVFLQFLISKVSTASRRRRKEEFKKQSLREGGVYEDIALMRALYELIMEVFSSGPIVRQLCLISFNINNGSSIGSLNSLHNYLLEFQLEINKTKFDIWPQNLNNLDPDDYESAIYENIKFLDVKYREPPPNLDTSWSLSVLSSIL
ncbi:hypothetical protein FQA39_LY15284 [Lamprigera yunnana]|nr:hypothetical protein FQA39_LY15284 [Lamprigera yunnana]